MRFLGVTPLTFSLLSRTGLAEMIQYTKSREGFKELNVFRIALREYLSALDGLDVVRFDPSDPSAYQSLVRDKLAARKTGDSEKIKDIEDKIARLSVSLKETQKGIALSEAEYKFLQRLVDNQSKVKLLYEDVDEFLNSNSYGMPKYFKTPLARLKGRRLFEIFEEYRGIENLNSVARVKEYNRMYQDTKRLLNDFDNYTRKEDLEVGVDIKQALESRTIIKSLNGEESRINLVESFQKDKVYFPDTAFLELSINYLDKCNKLDLGLGTEEVKDIAVTLGKLGIYGLYTDIFKRAYEDMREGKIHKKINLARPSERVYEDIKVMYMDMESKKAGGKF